MRGSEKKIIYVKDTGSKIFEEAHPDANIIWGARFDPNFEDEMRVTIIATGFDKIKAAESAASKHLIANEPEAPVQMPEASAPQMSAAPVFEQSASVAESEPEQLEFEVRESEPKSAVEEKPAPSNPYQDYDVR